MWLFGIHAVMHALDNPKRKKIRLIHTTELQKKFQHVQIKKEIVEKSAFDRIIGTQAVHQGCALEVAPLNYPPLEEIIAGTKQTDFLLMLDQITDPHNFGSIVRSAAAFQTTAIIFPEKNSPNLSSGTLAKTASGGLEHIPLVPVINLARTIDTLKQHNFWVVGLDETGQQTVGQLDLPGPIALIMGAESKGLRQLTKSKCDMLVKLPTNNTFPTLNVSNAAAITLYAIAQKLKSGQDS